MKTALVTIFDAGYIEQAAVFMDSVSENYHSHEELDLLCMLPEESAESFNELKDLVDLDPRINLKLVVVPTSEYGWLSEKTAGHWGTATTWYRLFLGSLLPEYDKAVYLDVDMLVVENIQPLLNHPMHNKFMSVMDTLGVEYLYQKTRGDVAYLTDGVFIVDLGWWRESGIEDVFKAHIQDNQPEILVEEHVLNTYIKPYWHPLPFTFNYYMFKRDRHGVPDFDEGILPVHYKHAIIFHFAGKVKPWTYEDVIVGRQDESNLGAEWRRRLEVVRSRR